MKFSYSAVWDDAVQLFRSHGSLIVALAGVFIFLPGLLTAALLPQPQAQTVDQLMEAMRAYVQFAWPWVLLETLVNMIGTIAILRLIFPRQTSTVGAVIAASLPLVPTYFVAAILSNITVGLGLLLFIIPGIYLLGRLTPVGPVIVAEERRNPIDALRRSFQITAGKGWAVAGLVLIVAIAGVIVMVVANNLIGLVLLLIAGQKIGGFLTLIVGAITAAAFTTLLVLLYAAIYRRLAEPTSAEVFQ
ncbi:hypothetical protein E2493_12695 [Sphingomonas parva]|uniref:Uncharacterized protein n=1 Tax=Sphingomonas parva TaxID=2555898 RepID=A0A4Y8ZTQ4_9SPHN|nr:YciC family protein [Sphingomonas parva]TFI57846.1 hypothetical protein E2493_12695 [Sphingomonas parva]